MPVTDTSTTMRARQLQVFRGMTPAQRVELAIEMSDEIRAVAEAGIRGRHPQHTDDEVRAALLAILLGRESAALVLGGRSRDRR
jgi:DUF1365 family protein